jgi:hypothetical protein
MPSIRSEIRGGIRTEIIDFRNLIRNIRTFYESNGGQDFDEMLAQSRIPSPTSEVIPSPYPYDNTK